MCFRADLLRDSGRREASKSCGRGVAFCCEEGSRRRRCLLACACVGGALFDFVTESLAGVSAWATGAAAAVEAAKPGGFAFGDDAAVGGASTLNVVGARLAEVESNGDALFGCGQARFVLFALNAVAPVALACSCARQTEPAFVGLFFAFVIGVGAGSRCGAFVSAELV